MNKGFFSEYKIYLLLNCIKRYYSCIIKAKITTINNKKLVCRKRSISESNANSLRLTKKTSHNKKKDFDLSKNNFAIQMLSENC